MSTSSTPARPAPVLLLHGQPGSSRDWDRVREELAGRAETIAPDRPGWDGSGRATDLRGNADAVLAALDQAGAQRAIVVGHSLGGAIGAWLAATEPDRVAALVLVAPAANTDALVPLDYVLGLPLLGELIGATALSLAGAALVPGGVRRRLGSALGLDGRYLKAASRNLLSPSSWRAFSSEQRMLIRELPALERRLERIGAPTSIVIGSADRIVPPFSARRLAAQIPDAELIVLEHANHLLAQRHARRLAEIILAAAAQAAAGSGSGSGD